MTSVEMKLELEYIRNNSKNIKLINDELDKFIVEHPVSKFMTTPHLQTIKYGDVECMSQVYKPNVSEQVTADTFTHVKVWMELVKEVEEFMERERKETGKEYILYEGVRILPGLKTKFLLNKLKNEVANPKLSFTTEPGDKGLRNLNYTLGSILEISRAESGW